MALQAKLLSRNTVLLYARQETNNEAKTGTPLQSKQSGKRINMGELAIRINPNHCKLIHDNESQCNEYDPSECQL